MARDVKPVITLAVSNATSSDGAGLALVCGNKTIAFAAAGALSDDAKSMSVTVTPQAGVVQVGDICTLTGDVSTTGAGGTAKTAISTSFSIYAAPVSVAKRLSLIAGTADSPGSKDGTLLEASMHSPGAMTKDAQGNIYVVEGSTGFTDSHALFRKISTTGTVTTIAGSASYGGGKWGNLLPPPNAKWINGITTHPDGNLYTIDSTTRLVQRITPQGQITTVAGALGERGSTDGVGTAARFYGSGITADGQGNLFIADGGNSTIRKIDPSGNVTTYAGKAGVSGTDNGDLQSARFTSGNTIKFDTASGKLFVGDQNGIRVISNGIVSTVIPQAQLMQELCSGGDMPPNGLDVSADGRIAVSYADCSRVGVYQNGNLAALIGGYRDFDDIDGSPSAAKLFWPKGVVFLSNGDLLISDLSNHNVKRYSAATNPPASQ